MCVCNGFDRRRARNVLCFGACILLACVVARVRCLAQTPQTCDSLASTIANETSHQEPSGASNRIVVILDANAPPETLAYLAQIAKKQTCETDVAQKWSAVAKVIGSSDAAVDALQSLNPSLSTGSSPESREAVIPPHTDLSVPEISPPPPDFTVHQIPFHTTAEALADRLSNKITRPNTRYQYIVMSDGDVHPNTAVKIPTERSVRVVNLPESLDAKAIADITATKPGVHFAAPDLDGKLEHPVQINSDALTSTHAGYDISSLKDDWFVSKIGADKLTATDFTMVNQVVVAVVDSGLDLAHPVFQSDLWDNISPGSYPRVLVSGDQHGYDFAHMVSDPMDTLKDSHGTHVAGIASARFLGTLRTALGATRLDPSLKLMIIRVADDDDRVSLGPITLAIDYATQNGAQILSASWTMANYPTLDQLFRGNPRTLFVVAAGNGTEATQYIGRNIDDANNRVYPASYEVEQKMVNVITVAASDPDGNVAYFSNWGPNSIDLLAPGVNIKSTVIHTGADGPWGYNSGSSQAAPFVTLTAALILSETTSLPVDAVKKRIVFTADATKDDLQRVRYGHLNLLKAVAINEDLIEMTDHTLYRGTIANRVVQFGAMGSDCTNPDKFDVSREKIFRIVVDFDGATSRLFKGTHVSTGRVCDKTVTIKTDTSSIDLSTAKIHDIIWRGIPQFELPN
jgi:hypothetical protein